MGPASERERATAAATRRMFSAAKRSATVRKARRPAQSPRAAATEAHPRGMELAISGQWAEPSPKNSVPQMTVERATPPVIGNTILRTCPEHMTLITLRYVPADTITCCCTDRFSTPVESAQIVQRCTMGPMWPMPRDREAKVMKPRADSPETSVPRSSSSSSRRDLIPHSAPVRQCAQGRR